jgi:glucokinase
MSTGHYIIGIDLGGTNVRLALFKRASKHIISQVRFPTKAFATKRLLFEKIARLIQSLISVKGLKNSEILGVGIGVPGPVDYQRGLVYYLPNIPGWNNVPLRRMLANKLKLPVFVDNDVKLMALAEHRFGAARNIADCICLTLGTGVGGALIIDGKLFRGASSAAGEIGHLPVALHGPHCACGGRACLERFIGNRIILAKARQIFGRSITLEELSSMARKGNKQAVSIWGHVGFVLGVALSGLINVFNPQRIIIGGGLANAGSILFNAVRRSVSIRAMQPQAKTVSIVRARLGENAGLIGASVLVSRELGRDR